MDANEEIVRRKMKAFLSDFSQVSSVHFKEGNEIYSEYTVECVGLNGDFKVLARVIQDLYCECRIVEGQE